MGVCCCGPETQVTRQGTEIPVAFIDEAVIEAIAGKGGNGCVAFRREKFVPRGGPSGGDGGDGGSVFLVGDRNLNTLYEFRHSPRKAAQKGRHGEGSDCTGKSGEDLEVPVPLGTMVFDTESEEIVAEVLSEGERVLVAKGGRGGRGNARFKTATRKTPRFAEDGREGEEKRLRLELRLLADVGLVGLPNAGKSTLISTVSAARPKIANYPFTTLVPQLGVVARGPIEDPFVIADLPGLIAGAAQGAGLGHQFLRHVDRCRVLVHMVDLSGGEGAYTDVGAEGTDGPQSAEQELVEIEDELRAFDPRLLDRSRLVVGTKVDSAVDERRDSLRAAAEARDLDYLEVSAVAHQGLDPLKAKLATLLTEAKAREEEAAAEEIEFVAERTVTLDDLPGDRSPRRRLDPAEDEETEMETETETEM